MRPRFTLRWLVVAVAILAVLFAALRYDIGIRGYVLFLSALAGFAISSVVASRVKGPGRITALALAALSCLAGLAAFAVFGTR